MKKGIYVERINIGDERNPALVDLYLNMEMVKDASYILRAYRALEALRKGPRIETDKGIEVYSTRLPKFRRGKDGIALHSAFIHPSPHREGYRNFWFYC